MGGERTVKGRAGGNGDKSLQTQAAGSLPIAQMASRGHTLASAAHLAVMRPKQIFTTLNLGEGPESSQMKFMNVLTCLRGRREFSRNLKNKTKGVLCFSAS